jgi:tetratricopeptide (TPR) repeat protein
MTPPAVPNHDAWSALRNAQALVLNGQRRKAFAIACRLAETPCERPDWNDALGTLFTYCEDPARARGLFERATTLAPTHTAYRYNLATAQRMLGEFAAAEAQLDAVIAANPHDARAYYTRTDLRTQTPERNHVAELLRALEGGRRPVAMETFLRFALAKELEDLTRYEEAFQHLERGCALQRGSMTYDVADDVATLDRIAGRHDRSALESHSGLDSEECIFVLGLPRTGTTLVERILACHSAVTSAGESPAFAVEVIAAVRSRLGRTPGKHELVERALEIDARSLGAAYLEAARPTSSAVPKFVDKQPLNYLYLGLIRRALPRARVIALVRDPMDSCFAMYKTLFAGAYPFSYDFSDLACYYAAWHRLMQHWRGCLADDLLIVRYEDLVSDAEPVVRRILRHCRLPWEEACLAFQHGGGPVTTASAVQVRRGLYSTSVGRWRCYERQLAPLQELLEPQQPATGWSLATRA